MLLGGNSAAKLLKLPECGFRFAPKLVMQSKMCPVWISKRIAEAATGGEGRNRLDPKKQEPPPLGSHKVGDI